MSLETNYVVVFLFAQKRVRFGRDNLPFSEISWDTLPQSHHLLCGMSRGWAILLCDEEQMRDWAHVLTCKEETSMPWDTRHLLTFGLYFCALFSPGGTLACLVAAAQRHYPERHCCHPTPTSSCVEVKLSCGLTTSMFPVLNTSNKLLSPCYLVQFKAQLTLHLLLNLASHFETRLCYS